MTFYAFGLNHETAPVGVREAFALNTEAKRRIYRALDLSDEAEVILLSTCNRTEAYLFGEEADVTETQRVLAREVGTTWPEDSTFLLEDEAAVQHVLAVPSGLRSLVLGETQILGQVKDAYRLAARENTVEAVLHRLMHAAFRTAKRVVRETALSSGAASVSSAAVAMARSFFRHHDAPTLNGRSVLLVGTGRMGVLALKSLTNYDLGQLEVTNRTRAHAQPVAAAHDAQLVDWSDRYEAVGRADLVIVATGSDEPVIVPDLLPDADGAGTLLIDIAVPRNVAPTVDEERGYTVYDLDTLNERIVQAEAERRAAVPEAERIVEEEMSEYVSWFFHQQALQPAIHALRSTFDSIRRQEIERHEHRFSEVDREELDRITQSILQKLLAVPIVRLKSTDPESIDFVRGIRLLNTLFSRPGCEDEENVSLSEGLEELDPEKLREHLDLYQALHASDEDA